MDSFGASVTWRRVPVGWVALIFRIRAEERMLARDAAWGIYVAAVRYCLLPGVW